MLPLKLMQHIWHNLPVVFYKHRGHRRQKQLVPKLAVKKNRWWFNHLIIHFFTFFHLWSASAIQSSFKDETRYTIAKSYLMSDGVIKSRFEVFQKHLGSLFTSSCLYLLARCISQGVPNVFSYWPCSGKTNQWKPLLHVFFFLLDISYLKSCIL